LIGSKNLIGQIYRESATCIFESQTWEVQYFIYFNLFYTLDDLGSQS